MLLLLLLLISCIVVACVANVVVLLLSYCILFFYCFRVVVVVLPLFLSLLFLLFSVNDVEGWAVVGPHHSVRTESAYPMLDNARARLTAVVDLPTPPLPEATTTTCDTPTVHGGNRGNQMHRCKNDDNAACMLRFDIGVDMKPTLHYCTLR